MTTIPLAPLRPLEVMADHWERLHEGFIEPKWNSDPKTTLMRRLSPVEFASLCVVLRDDVRELRPPSHGPVTDAALRIALWEVMGKRFSGYRLAREMQHYFWSHAQVPREPWRGWDMLAAVDAYADLHGVELWLTAEPVEPRGTHFRPMRLSERLAELRTSATEPIRGRLSSSG